MGVVPEIKVYILVPNDIINLMGLHLEKKELWVYIIIYVFNILQIV